MDQLVFRCISEFLWVSSQIRSNYPSARKRNEQDYLFVGFPPRGQLLLGTPRVREPANVRPHLQNPRMLPGRTTGPVADLRRQVKGVCRLECPESRKQAVLTSPSHQILAFSCQLAAMKTFF